MKRLSSLLAVQRASTSVLRGITVARSTALLLACCLTGCGWFGGEEKEEEFVSLAAPGASVEQSGPPAEATLSLNLDVGQRFPLLKTVEQVLSQKSGNFVATSASRLELLLSLQVEEIRSGQIRFGVFYQRVRYTHDIAGDKVDYDSTAPPQQIPTSAQAYQGLVGNGFSFWVGADNKIVELVGFPDFLQRCVRNVPISQRQAVLTKLAETSGEEGIANFVDDSIGLLPNQLGNIQGPTVKVGDTWTTKRQIVRPLPLYLADTCMLKAVNERYADIDIVGTISPSATYGPSDQDSSGVHLTVRGGHCFGTCTIDRTTGLPVQSRIERYLDMQVELPDGRGFEQHKKIVTTIAAFPEQSAPATHAAGGATKPIEAQPATEPRRVANAESPQIPR